jgi:hypothetical protein
MSLPVSCTVERARPIAASVTAPRLTLTNPELNGPTTTTFYVQLCGLRSAGHCWHCCVTAGLRHTVPLWTWESQQQRVRGEKPGAPLGDRCEIPSRGISIQAHFEMEWESGVVI